ncbi:HD-like signal output (HDOD) domain, no enzymatic activity [Colwellia chukchiensis]|uniref:HD-like signal output (HDOD) domain, no enzymatic activity n=1 Tax=Colwellia chukchiensis TaxID=641665 RepID=A0A1H7QLL8_9GAMM|nr:HDOD domain-containing protein [Colwellia chukchiensis]SEL48990.1 HD-like signal output (HDOD) domain, no enzymatic activity [Colwellia chukchiensis]
MQIFEDSKLVAPIYSRALSLAISKDFAEKQSGKITLAKHQGSEQLNRRRELLAVEEEANKNKIIQAHGQEHFRNQVMRQFFSQVNAQVDKDFDHKENLYMNVLKIEDAAPSIMEILALKAASINRITPLAKALPWLCTELINLVNKPQYRKRADVQVTEPSLALSYIGLDNLKLVMPTFMLKHWLPSSTAPFPLMKRKLWNDSLSIALAAKVLAKEQGLDEFTAFTAAMLSNLGLLAVTRGFLNTYGELYNKELREAYENKDKKLHDALVGLDAAPELLLEQLVKRSSKVAADMVELMRFDRLQITEPLFDLAYAVNIQHMSPIAKLITKAKSYIAFRSLAKADLINTDEAKILLSAGQLTTKDIALLKKSDIDHIKLIFN